jgi:hypothetical protein
MEFIRIKILAKAEIFFVGKAFERCRIGEKKIPPPIPTKPAKKPTSKLTMEVTILPKDVSNHLEGNNTSFCLNSIRPPESSNTAPKTAVKDSLLMVVFPPNQAKGIDIMIAYIVNFQGIKPCL